VADGAGIASFAGKIYQHVIDRERKGEYLGKTVQVVPHVTGAIQDWIGACWMCARATCMVPLHAALSVRAERVAAIPVDGSQKVPDSESDRLRYVTLFAN
jgi:hypothetical protein